MLRRGKKLFEMKHIISSGSNAYVLAMDKFILSYRRQFLGIWRGKLWRARSVTKVEGLGLFWDGTSWPHVRGRTGEGRNSRREGMRFVPLLTQFLYCHYSCLSSLGFWEGHFSLALPKRVTQGSGNTHCCCWGIQNSLSAFVLVLLCLNLCGGLNTSRKSHSCNSTSICSYWRASDIPSLSCSFPMGESWFILIGSEFAAEADPLWPKKLVLADGWMSWGPSKFDICCPALGHHDSPPSLAFLSVLSIIVHGPVIPLKSRICYFVEFLFQAESSRNYHH